MGESHFFGKCEEAENGYARDIGTKHDSNVINQ
jgi:hypothetical protein